MNAVVTGASSGIGRSISKYLLNEGYTVYSVTRETLESDNYHENIHFDEGDLLDRPFLNQWTEKVKLLTNHKLDVLIHSAGFGLFKPLDAFKTDTIGRLTQIHLSVPMIITKHFLPDLIQQKGHVLAIGSHTGMSISRWGGPYAAAKAGLHHFMKGLFEDYRKQGLKVTTIIPDITNTHFYDDLDFSPSNDPLASIDPDEIAKSVAHVLSAKDGSLISEIVLRPQKLLLHKKSHKKK